MIASALLGVAVFGGLAYYRIVFGWSSTISESDKAALVVAADVEKFLEGIAIRTDQETWSKTWFPSERCSIVYKYEHPDLARVLRIESYLHTETTRKDSFDKWNELVNQYQSRFAALVPDAAYINRDVELMIGDQSRFGSFNEGDQAVAYFFARRRGKHIFFGFVQCAELDDGRIGDVFAAPSSGLADWTPSP